MGRHSPADAELNEFDADRLRSRALQLVAELDTLDPGDDEFKSIWAWAESASVILKELARG